MYRPVPYNRLYIAEHLLHASASLKRVQFIVYAWQRNIALDTLSPEHSGRNC